MSFLRRKSKSFTKFSYKKLRGTAIGRTPYQKILRIYALIILIGATFLVLPISRAGDASINFFDACFTAISAFTNTGLTTHTTSSTFNFFGQLIILLLIQIGGMGFMTLLVFLWIFIRKSNYNTEQRWFLHFERGSYSKVETLPVVKSGILFLLITELIGAILLSFFFYFAEPLSAQNGASSQIPFRGNVSHSIWAGVFHSISAANNAGFDIIGSKSIVPFRNQGNNFLSLVLLIESVIGGIGYPVFHDVFSWIKNKRRGRPTRFSLFSKVAVLSYFIVCVFSIAVTLFLEAGMGWRYNSLLFKEAASPTTGEYGWGNWTLANKVWNIIYITFSTRSSGFASLDPKELTEATRWFLSILMFIGTSPASTGGGIRTITIFIILQKMIQMASGRKHLTVYRKTIDQKVVYECWNVFVLSTILIVFSSFFIMLSLPSQSKLTIVDVIFEATSAFGTVGLSSGVTESCNFVGRIVLMLLMFIGQMGISNALVSVTDLNPRDNLQYCSESIRVA